jgi:fumarate hydratase subunit alpha
MRQVECRTIAETISGMFLDACLHLPDDVLSALKRAKDQEESPVAKDVLDKILKNIEIAASENIPLCQDTGTAVVFLDIGQDVQIVGGNLEECVNDGVRCAYEEGYLRKSMVSRPFSARVNTKDNTPAVIHTEIVPGDRIRISVMPKGGGSENCSRLTVLPPARGREGIIDFVVNLVDESGSNPCPPIIVGLGIGGTTDKAMTLAKKALLRRVGAPNPDPEVAELEREILKRINNLGIGAMGYGGRITALAVHAEVFPAHIASLPVAVNIQCWCARRKETTI